MGEHHWGSHVDGIDGYGSGVYTCEQDSIIVSSQCRECDPDRNVLLPQASRAMRSSGTKLGLGGLSIRAWKEASIYGVCCPR